MKFTISHEYLSVNVINPNGEATKEQIISVYKAVLTFLSSIGYTVTKNPRIEKDFPILSDRNDAGFHGDLKFQSEHYDTGCKFEFYQDVVFENTNGGYYDFGKFKKMPYLIRLRWIWTTRKLAEFLKDSAGLQHKPEKPKSPVPGALNFFNHHWDMGGMERGELRFDRGPDGWPSEKEIGQWSLTDGDGNRFTHGDIRYTRDAKGYLLRGRVYGGINGMWLFIYGPGKHDYTHVHYPKLFTCSPASVPRKVSPDRQARLNRELRSAVESQNFERAIILRDLLKEVQPNG